MKPFSIILTFCLTVDAYAQELSARQPLDIDVEAGIMLFDLVDFSATEWNYLTPGYKNKDETDTSYHISKGGVASSETVYFQVQGLRGVTWENLNKRNINTFYGASLALESGFYGYREVGSSAKYRVDTLTSSTTGAQIFVDSNVHKTEKKVIDNRFVDFGASLMFQINREGRFSFLTGLTVTAAIQHRGRVYVSNTTKSWNVHSDSDPGIEPEQVPGSIAVSDPIVFSAPWVWQVGARVPLELNCRLGGRFGFLENWSYSLSIIPGYRYSEIDGFGSRHFFNTAFIGGLKYRVRG